LKRLFELEAKRIHDGENKAQLGRRLTRLERVDAGARHACARGKLRLAERRHHSMSAKVDIG
jgi:putative component of toxin-antitoxin plasmid stabilization module